MRRFSRVFLQTFSLPVDEQDKWSGHPHGVAWQPFIDIYECEDGLVVVAELPGVDKSQISVAVQDNVLRITGARHKEMPSNTSRVHQMEIPHGPFARAIELPLSCDIDNIQAEYDKGYLTIRIPGIHKR